MEFFNSAVDVLQTLVIALGAGLGIWGVINLLEGYGNDNPGAKWPGIFLPKTEWRSSYAGNQSVPVSVCGGGHGCDLRNRAVGS